MCWNVKSIGLYASFGKLMTNKLEASQQHNQMLIYSNTFFKFIQINDISKQL
jgi:hypothetical protein